ncbi:FHA domain-containing protein [Alexandriicola marinus]|uniref:FHA domain-containing protein n=1 Tax=Alexandriicola marinus TaxID=2081710 RepID=UPI001EED3867|nr:FHA domain-containing protein [Alexandriicola marinus]
MNFIRDIIGEKRQSTGLSASEQTTRPDDRSREADPDRQDNIALDRPPAPTPWTEEDLSYPAAADDDQSSDTAEFGFDDEAFLDEVMSEPEDDAEAAPIKADRDVYEELRSIFVAEDRHRVLDGTAPPSETASLKASAEQEPLRAAIARVGREYGRAGVMPAAEPDDSRDASLDTTSDGIDAQAETPHEAPVEPVRHARAPEPAPSPGPELPRAEEAVSVPGPAMGRGSSHKGRVKTRLLGFNIDREDDIDPIAGGQAARPAAYTKFPLGWLIVTDGPGRGAAFTLFNGVSQIGRGKDQTISLDFGDNSISRENHAAIAYDPTQNTFFIGHGGKANLVRRNDRPVLATEELAGGDRITIGETSLRFVPLCGEGFSWQATEEGRLSHAVDG